jgi:hypothetical protein
MVSAGVRETDAVSSQRLKTPLVADDRTQRLVVDAFARGGRWRGVLHRVGSEIWVGLCLRFAKPRWQRGGCRVDGDRARVRVISVASSMRSPMRQDNGRDGQVRRVIRFESPGVRWSACRSARCVGLVRVVRRVGGRPGRVRSLVGQRCVAGCPSGPGVSVPPRHGGERRRAVTGRGPFIMTTRTGAHGLVASRR